MQVPPVVGIRHPVTRTKCLQELVEGCHRAGHNLGHRCPAEHALRIDQHHLVALRQVKPPLAGRRLGVVNGEVAGGCLLLQPLAGVAFVRPGTSGQLPCGCGATLMQGPVEPELVANVDAEELQRVDQGREYAAGDLVGRGIARMRRGRGQRGLLS
jgi:hypothetical protein